MMQNENGSRITMEEYWKLPIEEVFSNKWTEVVTNAEIVEFSFVSVRSNRASVLTTKVEQYARVNKIDTKQVYSLISNNFTMADTPVVEPVVETPVDTPVDTPAPVEAPKDEAPVENLAETVETLNALVKTLSAEVESLKANAVTRETLRANLANVPTAPQEMQTNAITPEGLIAKYRK
jgi:predicted Zn-dependent protease